jgi:hypothetical protein
LLRPYLTLLSGRHLGLPHPSRGRDTKYVHISAISCELHYSGNARILCRTFGRHETTKYSCFLLHFYSNLIFEQRAPSGWTTLLSQNL